MEVSLDYKLHMHAFMLLFYEYEIKKWIKNNYQYFNASYCM